MRGLRPSADYYKINIDGVISQISGQIVDRCFADGTDFCSDITFVRTTITQVRNRQIKLAGLGTSGWDFEASYNVPVDAVGVPGCG